jgi:hypothetical protein
MDHPNLDGLSLNEEEEEGFSFEFEEVGEEVDLRWCLVGRFLCDRTIHFNSMRVRMADLWKPVKGVIIKEVFTNQSRPIVAGFATTGPVAFLDESRREALVDKEPRAAGIQGSPPSCTSRRWISRHTVRRRVRVEAAF